MERRERRGDRRVESVLMYRQDGRTDQDMSSLQTFLQIEQACHAVSRCHENEHSEVII